MWINVILAIDERLDDVKDCVDSIRNVYGLNAPIALATYGGAVVGLQVETVRYAYEQGFIYFDAPRHDFLTPEDVEEWHCNEALARMQITRHFSRLGYDEVYIMHADVRILGDFRKRFQESISGDKWSFVAFLLRARDLFEDLCEVGSWSLYFSGNSARLSDLLVRYNSSFVGQLYAKFWDERGIWDSWLSQFMLFSDLAQFDIARGWEGYKGIFIKEETDIVPICGGAVLHQSRERIPGFVTKWPSREIIQRNFDRRFLLCQKP